MNRLQALFNRFLLLALFCSMMAMQAKAADYNEIPATIVEVDVPGNAVVLFGLGFGEARYSFAYDLEIKLLGGAPGTINNLRSGDGVTALVDNGSGLVHALFVVSSDS